MSWDALVIGAGFSGAVMAERFASVNGWRVLVLEQREHIGGNCYDYRNEQGIIVHRYGPHLFHTSKQRVWDYLSQFTDWHPYEHKVLTSVDGQLVPLPFNLNTLHQMYPPSQAARMEQALIASYGVDARVSILQLKEHPDELLQSLGRYVYERFFVNYTTKQWGCRPEDISPQVIARVPVVISRDDRYFHDTYQAIPRQGYTALFKQLLANPKIKVELKQQAGQRIRLVPDSGEVLLDNRPFKGPVVYTGMLDELFGFGAGELPYRSLQFEYETLETHRYQPATTVNYPNEYRYTRITEFKHILPCESRYTTIVREYPQDYQRDDPQCNIPYYPVFTEQNQQAYENYREMLDQYPSLLALGRLADYRYYNMDDAVDRALGCFEEHYGNA